MFNIFKKKQGSIDTKPQPNVKEIHVAQNKWRYVVWLILIIISGVIIWLTVSGVLTFNKITSINNGTIASFFKLGNNIKPTDIKKEGDSRINILLSGIGGAGHDGPDLTDTLQVISIDPINKTVVMLSVPRDLYVKQADGEWTKVNAVNADASTIYCKVNSCPSGVDKGGEAMKATIGSILGIQINNFIRLDFNGFKQLVDTVGGVDVNVPTTLSDPLYPCPDPSTSNCPIYIKDGQHHFDGTTALEYARSRETTSDFDRSKRQQLIIEAILTKSKTLGIVGNPAKVNGIFSALGNNVKTDLSPSDMAKLVTIESQIDQSKNTVATLDTSTTGPLMDSSDTAAGYIIFPRLGLGNYTDVQTYVSKILLDPYIVKEQANISIVNTTGKSAETSVLKTLLSGLGYNIVSATSGPTQLFSSITTSSSKPYTESLLKQRFSANELPSDSNDTSDITLTIGSNYLIK